MKDALKKLHDSLAELETEARKLKNQNLGDIIAAGKAKVAQALSHPDMHELEEKSEGQEPLPFAPPGANQNAQTQE